MYGCVFTVSRSSGTSSRGYVAELNRACYHHSRDPAVHYWVCEADMCCHAWGIVTVHCKAASGLQETWWFSVLRMFSTSLGSGWYFFFPPLVSTKGSDHPIPTQTLRLPCNLCRWSGKQCLKFILPLDLLRFDPTVSSDLLKPYLLGIEVVLDKTIQIYTGCSFSVQSDRCLVLFLCHAKDSGAMEIEIHCIWHCHCHTLLSAVLSLQAYAVQGQHAIPQPDVSEGPSVSDPICLRLQSWEAMSPSYFIPLTFICPAVTAWYTSLSNDSEKSSHGFI